MDKPSIGSAVYTGAAVYGKFQAVMALIFGVIFSLLLIGFGLDNIRTSKALKGRVDATIKTSKCNYNESTKMYDCNLELIYTVKGQIYEHVITKSQTSGLSVGQKLMIFYDEEDPHKIDFSSNQKGSIGRIMVIAGVVIALIVSVSAYFTFRYKEVAAIQGGLGITQQIFQRR